MRRAVISLGIVLIVMISTVGLSIAASVYLNGVNIDGITNQKFKDCTVTIDQHGTVHIHAPGYEVKTVEKTTSQSKPQKSANSKEATRYWLIKDENYAGKAQYDIDVYINSIWIKRLRSDGLQVVEEITKHLKPGPNAIHLSATKNIGKQRKSLSPQAYIRVIIGEGNMGGDNVYIENPLVTYRRTAEETKDYNDEFTISVK